MKNCSNEITSDYKTMIRREWSKLIREYRKKFTKSKKCAKYTLTFNSDGEVTIEKNKKYWKKLI